MKIKSTGLSGRCRAADLMAAIWAAAIMGWMCTGTCCAIQVPKPASPATVEETRLSNVRDAANLFSAGAVAGARKELRDFETKTGVATMIATVETLDGLSIETEAERMAKESGIEGIFILISKIDKKIQVLVSRRYLGEMMKRQRDVIRTTFIAGFRHGDFDQGIKQGVTAIGESLIRAQRAGELAGKSAIPALGGPDEKASGSLLLRNQVRLTLAGARVVIAGAEEKARSLKLNVNIAVVDDGGHLLAFERMDGARPASGYTAITKATSAATFRQPSGPLGQPGSSPDPLLNLSLQNAASASGGKITTLFGGKPLVVEEQVIGAVGVGGGTGEQDSEIAGAGVSALIEQLGGGAPRRQTGAAEKPR